MKQHDSNYWAGGCECWVACGAGARTGVLCALYAWVGTGTSKRAADATRGGAFDNAFCPLVETISRRYAAV